MVWEFWTQWMVFHSYNLLGEYSLLSQNLQKYMPCKEDCTLVCLNENVFLLVPEITGSMACWTWTCRRMWFVAINDIVLLNGFGDLDTDNEWCFIDNNLFGNIHSNPRTCRNTYPEKKTVFWFAWKRTYFCWCLKLQEAWRAGHEPVRECGLAINDTALLNGFGHNEWCFVVNNLLGQYSLLRECILIGGWKRSHQSKQSWLAGHEPEISNSFGRSEFGQKV